MEQVLDVHGIVMLAGGPVRVAQTALAGLALRGAVHVGPAGEVAVDPRANAANPVEDAVLRGLGTGNFLDIEGSAAVHDLARD